MIAAAAASIAVDALDAGPVLCLFRRFTGIPCPGCGLTRGVARLMRGELRQSLALHPLAPVIVLEAAALWVVWGGVQFRRLPRPSESTVLRLLWVNLASLAVVWLARLALGTLPG